MGYDDYRPSQKARITGAGNSSLDQQALPINPVDKHHSKDFKNGHSERSNWLTSSLSPQLRVGSQAASGESAGLYQKQMPGVMPRIG